ncbi:transglycosylase domain-containing protein [Ideonella sp. 4Y16]|uniref:transglycosylase domain-containing protein n=1 Tax=Ideonella alba TaxID=2824118 RepID=UPI001B39AC26|nr:transglycosylase domain-containing protein [Ideonella alba]MBQ0942264.1 transglycosylase domain-containing protein [Ideonella alba]
MDDDAWIKTLQRDEARRRAEIDRLLRGGGGSFWPQLSGAATLQSGWTALVQRAADLPAMLRGTLVDVAALVALQYRRLRQRLRSPLWRRVGLGLVSATAALLLAVASQVWWGYDQHPATYWAARLEARKGSALYSADGQFQGSLYPAMATTDGLNFADYGYVAMAKAPPPPWVAMVLALEHKTLFNPWRNVCGLDPLGIAARVLTGSGGGSGLAEQNARNLAEPEEQRPESRVMRVVQKFRLWGAACSLYRSQGGAEGMVRLYAAYAPMAMVGGTLRGLDAASRVIFDRAPDELSLAQVALLATLPQRPLALSRAALFAKGCQPYRETAKSSLPPGAAQAAHNQCHNLARARVAVLRTTAPGAERDEALQTLDGWEHSGIEPVNPLAPVPLHRLMTLTSRTQATLGTVLLQHVAADAERAQLQPGEPLTLTMAQPEQTGFAREARSALAAIDQSMPGLQTLCVPLGPGSPLRQCPGTPDEAARADVVLARIAVGDGSVRRLYESSRLAYGARNAIGSIGKMVIALAAARAGLSPETLVCPRQVRDGDRLLRRITRPETGFTECRPAQLITLSEMMARSDNLAAYELARHLGPQALRDAAQALGLVVDDAAQANLAYGLAFGTLAATPAQLLALGQALFGVAFGVPVQAQGPRLLASVGQQAPSVYRQVSRHLPSIGQRDTLRRLLQAPVQHPSGTLHHLADTLAAGKTGTTSARYAPAADQRPYQQAKYTLAYVPGDRSVVLSIIGAPAGHALGLHTLKGETLAPAVRVLLQPAKTLGSPAR